MLKTVMLNILLETVILLFRILWWIRCLKEQHLFKIQTLFEIVFCNHVKLFAVAFDQFNASLLNKIIQFTKKINKKKKTLLTPNFQTVTLLTDTLVQFWFKNDINNISDNAHYKFGSTEVMPDTDGAVVVQIRHCSIHAVFVWNILAKMLKACLTF